MSVKNNISNLIINGIIILILAVLSQYNAIAWIVALFAVPALISKLVCYHGMPSAVIVGVSSVIFLAVSSLTMGSDYIALSICSFAALMVSGYIIGFCFRTKRPFSDMMLFSVGFDLAVFLIILAVLKYITNVNLTAEIRNILSDTFMEQFELIGSVYPEIASNIEAMEGELFNSLYIAMPGLIPFCVFTVSVLLFLIKYAISKNTCTRYLVESENFLSGFDTFRLGPVTSISFVIFIFCFIMSTSNIWLMLFLNAVLFVVLLYIVVAISVIDSKLKERISSAIKRYFAIFGIIIVSVILTAFMPFINPIYILIIIGIMDSLLDFRKLKAKKR